MLTITFDNGIVLTDWPWTPQPGPNLKGGDDVQETSSARTVGRHRRGDPLHGLLYPRNQHPILAWLSRATDSGPGKDQCMRMRCKKGGSCIGNWQSWLFPWPCSPRWPRRRWHPPAIFPQSASDPNRAPAQRLAESRHSGAGRQAQDCLPIPVVALFPRL